jgi:hypothetical protein
MRKLTIILLLCSPFILQAMQRDDQAAKRKALLRRAAQLTGEMKQNADTTAQHISQLPEEKDLPLIAQEEKPAASSYYDYVKVWGTRAALLGAGGLTVYLGFPREVVAQEPEVQGKVALFMLKTGKFLVQWAQKHSK